MVQIIKRFINSMGQRLRPPRPWYKDLCDYYGVTPEQALQLGTRASGRRPELPGSPTTHAVSGLTIEEIWDLRNRETPGDIHAFYADMGAWATFRQVVYHRNHSFDFVMGDIEPGVRLCEYGAGVAPLCFWILEHLRNVPIEMTIVDVASEHLTFGQWRLQRRVEELRAPITLHVREVLPDTLPLDGSYDMITILEVYEHLHNPLEVTVHLYDHLKQGGLLWENYIVSSHPNGADLAIAQKERPQVLAYLRKHYRLISGKDPDIEGSATRCWRKR